MCVKGENWMKLLISVGAGAFSLLLGLIIWIVASVVAGIDSGLGQPSRVADIWMKSGFTLMTAGPIIGWIMMPVYRRRSGKYRLLSWAVLVICSLFIALVMVAMAH